MTLSQAVEAHRNAARQLAATLREQFPTGTPVKCYALSGTARVDGIVKTTLQFDGGVMLEVVASRGVRFQIDPHRYHIERQPL